MPKPLGAMPKPKGAMPKALGAVLKPKGAMPKALGAMLKPKARACLLMLIASPRLAIAPKCRVRRKVERPLKKQH